MTPRTRSQKANDTRTPAEAELGRLRAVEAAAREVLAADGAAESGWDEADRRWDAALDALRAALSRKETTNGQ